jgi:titin
VDEAHESRTIKKSRFSSDTRRRRCGRWWRALAAACLAVAVTAGPALAAGGAAAAVPGRILAPAVNEACSPPSAKAFVFKICLTAATGDRLVVLNWLPSVTRDDFAIYYSTEPGSKKPAKLDNATGMSAQVKALPGGAPLVNGTTYYFWLAPAGRGLSPVSNTVAATPAAARAAPGEPTGLTATPGDSQVTLSWTAPKSDGGATISGYVIHEGTRAGGETNDPVRGSPVTGTSTTVTGLDNGTTYYFTVTAVNRAGQGQASAEVSATPAPGPGAVPGAVAGLTATAGNGRVTLSWSAPGSSDDPPVTAYRLYVGTTADFSGKSPLDTFTVTAATVIDLVNGTTYFFKVTAVNRAGEGPGTLTEAVPETTPGQPTGLTATPGNSQATLSWSAPASDGGARISRYIVFQGTSPGGETGDPVSGSPVTGTRTTVTGLVNGTTYYFTVVAVNAAGQSPQSDEASAVLLLIRPASPSPSSAATPARTSSPSGTVSPSSAASASATASPSSAASPSGSASPSTVTTPSGVTTSSGVNTPSGVTTQSSVDAASAGGTSAPAFAAPTGLTATAGDALVHLSWAAPPPGGGPPVSSYKVYLSQDPGVRASTALASTTGTAGTVANLVNGTVYYFMVTAVTAAGEESPASTEVSAEPTGPARGVTVSLDSPIVPKRLTALLAALAALAAAGVFTLIARHRRRLRARDPDGSTRGPGQAGQQLAAVADVRAVPSMARPDVVSVHDTGQQPTQTVRLEPHPGAATTTIKDTGP